MRMYSKAAAVARTLLREVPDSLEVRKYALIGLCGSDFAEDIARLRTSLQSAGVEGICAADAKHP